MPKSYCPQDQGQNFLLQIGFWLYVGQTCGLTLSEHSHYSIACFLSIKALFWCAGDPCTTSFIGGLHGHGMYESLNCAVPAAVVKNITLGTSVNYPHMLQYIRLDCENIDTAGGSPHQYPAIQTMPANNGTNGTRDWSRRDFSNVTLTSLYSKDGFTSASVYTSNKPVPNSDLSFGAEINPITQLTVGTLDGQTVQGGEQDATVTGDATEQFSFDLPSDARIYGFNIYYSEYINSISVMYLKPGNYKPIVGSTLPSFPTAPQAAVSG